MTRAFIYLTFLLYFSSQVRADQTLDQQKEALNAIKDAANSICDPVSLEGLQEHGEIKGEAKAKLDGVASKLFDIGVSGTGGYSRDQYKGLIRSDLAKAIADRGNCKQTVFKDLSSKLIQGPHS